MDVDWPRKNIHTNIERIQASRKKRRRERKSMSSRLYMYTYIDILEKKKKNEKETNRRSNPMVLNYRNSYEKKK